MRAAAPTISSYAFGRESARTPAPVPAAAAGRSCPAKGAAAEPASGASGDGWIPFRSRRARTKRSIGFLTQERSATSGFRPAGSVATTSASPGRGRSGSRTCRCRSPVPRTGTRAPLSIQLRSTATSAGVSGGPAGGIMETLLRAADTLDQLRVVRLAGDNHRASNSSLASIACGSSSRKPLFDSDALWRGRSAWRGSAPRRGHSLLPSAHAGCPHTTGTAIRPSPHVGFILYQLWLDSGRETGFLQPAGLPQCALGRRRPAEAARVGFYEPGSGRSGRAASGLRAAGFTGGAPEAGHTRRPAILPVSPSRIPANPNSPRTEPLPHSSPTGFGGGLEDRLLSPSSAAHRISPKARPSMSSSARRTSGRLLRGAVRLP